MAFFKAEQCPPQVDSYKINQVFVATEVSGTAAKEEIPLVDVDVFVSSQDRGCVEEGEKKFIFFE
jgi:hypothetical protein